MNNESMSEVIVHKHVELTLPLNMLMSWNEFAPALRRPATRTLTFAHSVRVIQPFVRMSRDYHEVVRAHSALDNLVTTPRVIQQPGHIVL